MDLLLLLTYTAICVAIFKIFKIPLNKWTVPTAALGGVVLVSSLVFLMNYNHPYSEIGRQYFVSTPIIPAVSGLVTEVPVKANTPLKAGEVLFQIDPKPYENRVASLKAQLVMADNDLVRANELIIKRAISARDVELAKAKVDQLKADLATSQYELEKTTVRAPTDGMVTQLMLRPGMMASNLPLRPLMVFINRENKQFVGWFRQNSLMRLSEGDLAEVTFDGIPGKIFSGKVKFVFEVLAEGQLIASGDLNNSGQNTTASRIPVLIDIIDPDYNQYENILPGGAFGQAAIYSKYVHHVAVMRKILLRMAAWMNYVFPIH